MARWISKRAGKFHNVTPPCMPNAILCYCPQVSIKAVFTFLQAECLGIVSKVGGWLLKVYVLATFTGQPRTDTDWLLTVCTHGDFIMAAPLGNQAASTMIWYLTWSHYPDTEPTRPCPILLMPNPRLGNDEYQLYKSFVWLGWELNAVYLSSGELNAVTRPGEFEGFHPHRRG